MLPPLPPPPLVEESPLALSIPSSVKVSVWIEMYPPPDPPLPTLSCTQTLLI
jgi:hypothetical protein